LLSDKYYPIDIKVFDLGLPRYFSILAQQTSPDSKEPPSKEAVKEDSGEKFEQMERSSEESSEEFRRQ
jgi:hypothetical protein